MLASVLYNIGYWMFHFLKYVAIILLIGTVIGAVAFSALGNAFTDYDAVFLLKKGISVGFRYAGVWAGGISIVFCIIKARKNYLKKHGTI